jgi:hypothetical protein
VSSQIQVPKTMIMVKDLNKIAQSEGFMALSWLMAPSGSLFTVGPSGKRSYNFNGNVEVNYWTFDGNFQQHTTLVELAKLPSPVTPFNINELTVYPMKYVDEKLQNTIRARGKMFWKCRRQHYVCYCDRSVDGVQNAVSLIDPALEIARDVVKLKHRLV